jgi:PAS domain S-box-containing protein
VNVLHLEDSADDARLVRNLLASSWPELTTTVVTRRDEFVAEIRRGGYDVILADYTLPAFSGLEALQLAQELAPSTPFVFLTGTLEEKEAIKAVEHGATDYVFKEHIQRLAIVIRRAVREGRERQKSAEALERLRQSEERYRKIFDFNPLPMWIVESATLAFLDVNEAAVRHYGFSHEEFAGLTLMAITADASAGVATAVCQSALDSMPLVRVSRHRTKAGALITVEVYTHEIDFEGRSARLMLINDVTEIREAAEKNRRLNAELEQRVSERTARLEEAMKELEAFSYSVSHDLRSPLRGIDGFARALMEDYAGSIDQEGQRLIATIRGETRRMGQLIDDLLAFSRAGRQPLSTAPVDMTELARSAFEALQERSPRPNVVLDLQPLPEATADRALMRQVFSNLLDNALKFTAREAAPRIEVTGFNSCGENIYCIKDNGVGFDPRYAHKLFGVFQRLHRQDEFEGTGVGLALVQRIIERHSGKTWAESKPTTGTRFYFSLPEQPGREGR